MMLIHPKNNSSDSKEIDTGKGKSQDKVICVHAMKAYRGSGGTAPLILTLDIRSN
jgi:hypothetical protein